MSCRCTPNVLYYTFIWCTCCQHAADTLVSCCINKASCQHAANVLLQRWYLTTTLYITITIQPNKSRNIVIKTLPYFFPFNWSILVFKSNCSLFKFRRFSKIACLMCIGVFLLIFKCSKSIALSISLYFSLKFAKSTDNEFEAILLWKNHQGYKVEHAAHALSLHCW